MLTEPKNESALRRIGRRALAAILVLITALLLVVATTVVAPHAPGIALAAHPVVQAFTAHLLLGGLACCAAGLLLRRLGSRRLGTAVVAAAALATAVFVEPFVALWRAGVTAGITPSLLEHLACGHQSGGPAEARSKVYGTAGGKELKLDVWLPRRAPGAVRTPAILWLHGGGFVRGSRGATPKWNEWLNERGYAVFDVEYRLAPPASWNLAQRDVACALGWVAMNAAEYNVDPRRLVVAGASAGGTLALLAAYGAHEGPPQRECEAKAPPVAAVLALYPVIDLREFWERNTVFGSSRRWSELFTGGSPSEVAERYDFVSPLRHVRADVPPTLVVEGVDDNVVLYKNAVALDAALAQAGASHQLVGLPQTDHGFDQFWGSFATQITRHTVERFLHDHLEIVEPGLPPTPR